MDRLMRIKEDLLRRSEERQALIARVREELMDPDLLEYKRRSKMRFIETFEEEERNDRKIFSEIERILKEKESQGPIRMALINQLHYATQYLEENAETLVPDHVERYNGFTVDIRFDLSDVHDGIPEIQLKSYVIPEAADENN